LASQDTRRRKTKTKHNTICVRRHYKQTIKGCSGVSRVWQVGHVPWAPLEGGATGRFLLTF